MNLSKFVVGSEVGFVIGVVDITMQYRWSVVGVEVGVVVGGANCIFVGTVAGDEACVLVGVICSIGVTVVGVEVDAVERVVNGSLLVLG